LGCPNCRTPFSEQDLANVNAAHRNAVYRRTIKCKYHEDGCPWTGQVGYEHRNVRKHEEKCDYVPRPCRLGCGVNVTAASREEHETNACPRRLVSCVQCGDRLPLFNLTSHQQASPSSDYPLTCAGYKICEFCFDNTSTGLRPRLVRHDDFGSHQVLCGSRLAPCTACTNAHSMPLIEHLQHYMQIGGDGAEALARQLQRRAAADLAKMTTEAEVDTSRMLDPQAEGVTARVTFTSATCKIPPPSMPPHAALPAHGEVGTMCQCRWSTI